MATFEEWTLFLASPGDVSAEREVVRRVVAEFNESIGKMHGVSVRVNGWETNARPAWGKDGQAIINDQIANMKTYELFVGIMWNRFGTKTPRAASGTREEFDLAVAARRQTRGKRPEIMFYFGTAPYTPKSKADNAQKDLVFDFKAEIEKKKQGLYWSFNGTAEFEELFRKHYSAWLNDKIKARSPKAKTGSASVAIPKIPNPKASTPKSTPVVKKPVAPVTQALKLQPILLDGHLFFAEKVTESGGKWTLILRPQDVADDRKINALSASNRRHTTFPLAYELRAGSASIQGEPERQSEGSGAFWTLELRFQPKGNNSMQVNFGNMNSDEIAQKKAEWLLLAQKPVFPAPKSAWETPDRWVEQQITGQGKDGQPVIPALWKQLENDSKKFKIMARLCAVSRLLSEGICEHLDVLEIGAIRVGKVAVKFSGTRSSVMSGKPQIIAVQGTCPLEITA